MKQETTINKVLPVLYGFFIMGFVDVVGISTSYVRLDFHISNKIGNTFPIIVFLLFFVLSIPVGLLMNKIGRMKTVIVSMVFTFIAMLIPILSFTFTSMLVTFGLIGIGNTILQVSLNPLLTNVVNGVELKISLTWGQFIKAIASFLGPIITGFAAIFLGNWKLMFLLFIFITIFSSLWLYFNTVDEKPIKEKTSSFSSCFRLLGDKTLMMLFFGVFLVVGVDVSLNTSIPNFLMEWCGLLIDETGLGTSFYIVARTTGAFLGAILLIRFSARKYFIISMIVTIAAITVALYMNNLVTILIMMFLLGFAVVNVFSIVFSAALQRSPEHVNEISGLMIMSVSGGALFPLLMGVVSGTYKSKGAAFVVLWGLLFYLLFLSFSIKGFNMN